MPNPAAPRPLARVLDRLERGAHWLFPRVLVAVTALSVVPLSAASFLSVEALKSGRVGFVPPCPVRSRTGVACPGCGLTRSVVAFVHGQPRRALRYHPAGPGVACVFLLCPALLGWQTRKRLRRVTEPLSDKLLYHTRRRPARRQRRQACGLGAGTRYSCSAPRSRRTSTIVPTNPRPARRRPRWPAISRTMRPAIGERGVAPALVPPT
jgi:hypothetical protein